VPPDDWLDPLFTAEEMRAADAYAIEEAGVPSIDLMERASAGLARVVAVAAGPGPIRVVVGKGNNGGDGLACARLLRDEGRDVDVLAVGDLNETKGDARANLERLPGAPPEDFAPERLAGSGAIVDAMLGTGFEGAPRQPVAGAITAINEAGAPVITCDVPSGVNATTGEIEGEAVRAGTTATFHGPKIGLYVAPGAFHAGRVEAVEIGIPRGAPSAAEAGLISDRVLELVPSRTREGSKFTSGTVVIAGGAAGYTGAPCMVALGAQRSGAGYVQLAVPESAQQAVALRLLEAVTKGLPEDGGMHVAAGVEEVEEMAERAGAVVLGPGLGRGDGPTEFARGVASSVDTPLVIDADGLNAHVGELDALRDRPGPTVLTPHAGELARLMDVESDEISAHRLRFAREAAERSGCVVLLKGDDTIVAPPGGPVAVSPGATAALATAGTGDVLAGVIGALLSKGMDALAAAAAGVRLHVYAGMAAGERVGVDHVVAGDVIEALPEAFRRAR
jgi:ADP-dependent NAD(P)H-hydrate dehydratase / NAD(P)H-hydrate epimerase